MKRLFPIVLTVRLSAGCTAPVQDGSYRQVDINEAIAMMEKETSYIILDVRTIEEFAEGHIPGAINIPNEDIGTAEIPVCCRSGNRSKQTSKKLVGLGYPNVVKFGGIAAYTGKVE